jgi:phosphoserine phosphatase
MQSTLRCLLIVTLTLGSAASSARAQPASNDPLPSWNDGPTKSAILDFVRRVTRANSPDFVPADERIAVFDNDGTLWGEQPMYVQLAFTLDRVKALAAQHPEWTKQEPFASVLKHELKQVAAAGAKGIMELLGVTHAGMTVEEFNAEVKAWITTARHPKTGKLYTEMVYQPMLELLAYLRANGFKTFIVSGGGVEFMRPWAERVYGIPPEQIVGSSLKLKFEMRDGLPTLEKLPEIDLVDDKAGKPVGIQRNIGRRPIFAAGNSDGDLQMLQYTTIARRADDKTPRFGLIVHHTDAEREYAYDRDSLFGRLDKALAEAPRRGWTVVDMKGDWNRVYPPVAP